MSAVINPITTLAEMRLYICRYLGEPVITIEIAPEQLDLVINEAIEDFTRYNYGEGLHKDFFLLNVSGGVSDYTISDPNDTSGAGIEDIVGMLLSDTNATGSINALFTPTNLLLGNGAFLNNVSNFGLVDYNAAMIFLEEVVTQFGIQFRIDYKPTRKTLKIVPTPPKDMVALLEVYKRETATNLFNHLLVKRLAVARAMVLWGRNIRKYSITLPGGGTLNGDAIVQDGKEMEEKAMEAIKGESEPIDFYIA